MKAMAPRAVRLRGMISSSSGRPSDPAHIAGGTDVLAALKAIALARAPFVSRGDRSDVNLEELRLWRLTGRTSEALTPEKWYRAIGGGMDQALGAAGTAQRFIPSPTARAGSGSATRASWRLPWKAMQNCSAVMM